MQRQFALLWNLQTVTQNKNVVSLIFLVKLNKGNITLNQRRND